MVSSDFFRVCPQSASTVVGMSLLSRVFTLLAFLLPLKIIILAGTSGVPKYFSGLINATNKNEWIAVLSVSAFALYLLALAFDVLSTRLVACSSERIREEVWKSGGAPPELDRVRGYYSSLWQMLADGLFVVVCLMVLVFLNVYLLAALCVMFFAEYLITALLLRKASAGSEGWLVGLLESDVKGYLDLYVSLNFLFGFLVIVAPFLVGGHAEILISIVSLIICRQLLSALGQFLNACVKLARSRARIEPLLQQRLHASGDSLTREGECLDDFLDESTRNQKLAEWLNAVWQSESSVQSHWQDFHVKNMLAFSVMANGELGESEKSLQLQVFGPQRKTFFDREERLFASVCRKELYAPSVVVTKGGSASSVRLLVVGDGEPVPNSNWAQAAIEILVNQWSVAPPADLVAEFAYSYSHLHQRLQERLFERLQVAAHSPKDCQELERFIAHLPTIRELVARLPLYIHNPDMSPSNVMRSPRTGRYAIMNWARWTIEPVGVELPAGLSSRELEEMVAAAKRMRPDIPSQFGVQELKLVARLKKIECWINQGKFRTALSSVLDLLQHPLLAEVDSDVLSA